MSVSHSFGELAAKKSETLQLGTLEEQFYPSLTPSTTPNTSTSSSHGMSKEQDTWLRATRGHQASQEWFW